MVFYEIGLNELLKIKLWGEEVLVPPRLHCTRVTAEHIMYVVTEGSLELYENGEKITLMPGDACFFPKNISQKPVKSTFCRYYYVHFDTELFFERGSASEAPEDLVREKKIVFLKSDRLDTKCYDYMKVYLPKKIALGRDGFFGYFCKAMENNILTRTTHDLRRRMAASAAFAELLIRLEDLSFEEAKSKEKRSEKSSAKVYRLAEYIEQHYNTQIKSGDIEREFFMNFDYLNRCFKKIMGISIMRYCTDIKLNHAKSLMATTSMCISEIALMVGFCDGGHFCRTFKKAEGMTPAEYRAKILGHNINEPDMA